MKSLKLQFIIPSSISVDDLAKVIDDIDLHEFERADGTKFKVKLKHTLIKDGLFVIEEEA